MGYYCTVPQCTSLAGKTKNVKFHRFPRDDTMAHKWNMILKRGKPFTKYSKVCSLHFTQADYNVTTMGQWKTLSKDAVPSQNLPKLNPDGTIMVIRKSRTVKYKEGRKEDSEKFQKWTVPSQQTALPQNATPETMQADPLDTTVPYRLQALSAVASSLTPTPPLGPKPRKQDAIMQTDPVQSEEDESHVNNSYSEASDNSFSEQVEYPLYQKEKEYQITAKNYTDYEKDKQYSQYDKDKNYLYRDPKEYEQDKKYEAPKDYTKQDDYMPQTNEEYNKEAEKYALERKSHNGYEKLDGYQKLENGFQKIPELYTGFEKDYIGYQGYTDSAEALRQQQYNIELLQQHRLSENQNFFDEDHIKQEIDLGDEDKFRYERAKEIDVSANHRSLMQQQRLLEHLHQQVKQEPETSGSEVLQSQTSPYYGAAALNTVTDVTANHRSLMQQQRLLEHLHQQVKQEPETSGSESVLQPQSSPYYGVTGHNNISGGYYDSKTRPGPELLIAKQNALAAHTQLWQNTMKRPFFYSDSSPYTGPQLLHRYEDLTRILQ